MAPLEGAMQPYPHDTSMPPGRLGYLPKGLTSVTPQVAVMGVAVAALSAVVAAVGVANASDSDSSTWWQ